MPLLCVREAQVKHIRHQWSFLQTIEAGHGLHAEHDSTTAGDIGE